MGQWRGTYLDTGPPRGPGHYSQDGSWWWDDDHQRWFRITDQEDVLEIEAEDVGGISLAASLLSTLSSQYGNGYFRFVARAHSADPRWPTYAMAGATFPGTRPSPADVDARAPGWTTSANGSTSCTASCSPRVGGRWAMGLTGGRSSIGGRISTGRRQLTPTNKPRGAHDAVLVTAASKYGATAEIAAAIAEVLDKHGLEATVLPPEQVKGVERHAGALAGRPVWLFSSGPVGDPPKPEEDPVDVADLLAATGPAAPPSSGRGPRTWPGTRPPMLRPTAPDGQRRRRTSGLGTRRGRTGTVRGRCIAPRMISGRA